MKNRLFNAFLLLAMVGVMFTACKKDYPEPPIQDLPIGTVYTIDSILKMEDGTIFNDDASVYGIVTADEVSGNLYKVAFLQDRATGAAIELYMNATSGVRIGDSIRVYLKGVTYKLFNGLPELCEFEPDGHIIILANGKPIVPLKTTITELLEGKHIARLVRLENVMFLEENTFADPTTYGRRTLVDANNPGSYVSVKTSNYANFAYDQLPQGVGNLIAIASYESNKTPASQLIIRSASEIDFDGSNHTGSLPYIQYFTDDFGTYTTYSVVGDQVWEIDYNTAKMTGHVGSSNFANEDWLISAPVALTGVNHVKVAVNYAAQYQNSNTEDVTLQISKDYVVGTNPLEANWIQMNVTYPNTSSWSDFQTVETSLDEFLGETVTVAIKFLSSETQSRTMEVKYILVEEGEPGGGGGGGGSGTVVGDGSRENPYTADDIILMGIETSDGNKYWVKDYIVGAIDPNNNYVYEFSASTSVTTNLIISSNVNASTEDESVPVQLPVGAVRDGLNLPGNPGNYQQEVLLYGTLEKYFQKPSVKNVTYAEINGNAYGNDPGGGGGGGGTTEYFNQTLTTQSSFNTFSAISVLGEQTWYQNASHLEYGAVMSGFANNVSYANEDWFISPVIDLSGSTNPILTFEHARGPEGSMNVGVEEGYYTVWVTNDYTVGEEPNQELWVELPILNQPTVKWQFVAAGDLVIPAEYKTSTCRIAFRYLSADGASATWEIKNVVVKEQ